MDDKKRVLIIDDDDSLRFFCAEALEGVFNEIDTAGSAEEAKKYIKEKKYDVVLLDIKLPGMQGNEYIKILKKEHPSTEVIMITGESDIRTAVDVIKDGAFDYIAKPFDVSNLINVVKKAIANREKKLQMRSKTKALIVDDDPAIRTLCKYALKDMFDEITEVGSSEEGMSAFAKQSYDIVLLDVMLPGIHGDEYIKQIKKEYPMTDVIMMTATPVLNVAVETLKFGAFDYISKPFDVKALKKTVEKAVCHQEETHVLYLENEWVMTQVQRIAHIGSWNIDVTDESAEFTDELYAIHGIESDFDCSVDNIINKLIHTEDRVKVRAVLTAVEKGEKASSTEWRIIRPNGEERILNSPGIKIITDRRGQTRRIIMPIQDITEQKNLEKKMRETNLFLRSILNSSSSISIILLELDGKILFWNKGAERMFGYRSEEVLGQSTNILYWDENAKMLADEVKSKVIENRKDVSREIEEKTKNGDKIWVSLTASPRLDKDGEVVGILGIAADITVRKTTENKLRDSLEKSKVLMREIQHRVKNNLNVILNFLDMQSRNANDTKISEVLSECKNRVNVMALIHAQLYTSQDIDNINIKKLARELLDNLTKHYTSGKVEIKQIIDIDEDMLLPIACSTPCGLIINELIVNAIKHAFTGRKTGEIKISMKESFGGRVTLVVSDNGTGMPPGLDISKCSSMGLKLVAILSEIQLQGSYEIDSSMGTKFTVKFFKE